MLLGSGASAPPDLITIVPGHGPTNIARMRHIRYRVRGSRTSAGKGGVSVVRARKTSRRREQRRDVCGGVLAESTAASGVAATECATFVLAHAAPHAMILPRIESPLEAFFPHVTAAADLLGLRDLHQGGSGVANGKEQLRVLSKARSLMAPIHGEDHSLQGEEDRRDPRTVWLSL